MDKLTAEIDKVSAQINAIEQLLDKDYKQWTQKEKQKFGNHTQLREERKQLRDKEKQLREERKQVREEKQELLKQQTLFIQKELTHGIGINVFLSNVLADIKKALLKPSTTGTKRNHSKTPQVVGRWEDFLSEVATFAIISFICFLSGK